MGNKRYARKNSKPEDVKKEKIPHWLGELDYGEGEGLLFRSTGPTRSR